MEKDKIFPCNILTSISEVFLFHNIQQNVSLSIQDFDS